MICILILLFLKLTQPYREGNFVVNKDETDLPDCNDSGQHQEYITDEGDTAIEF